MFGNAVCMRKLLFLSAVLLINNFAFAGKEDLNNVTSNPTLPSVFPHFNTGAGGSNNGAVKTHLRLVGKAYSIFNNGSFQPVDSVTYAYSNGRGGVPNPEDMNNDEHIYFDVSVKYLYQHMSASYTPYKQREQIFKNDNVSQLTYLNWDVADSRWENDIKYVYRYDPSGKMSSSSMLRWYANLWTQSINSSLGYDNSNNVVKMNSTTYNVDFYYDANNNLIAVEDSVYSQSAGGWVKNERKQYSYAGSNVTEYVLAKWNGGNWVNEERYEYQYDANDNVIVNTSYSWSNGTWVNDKRHTYKYDANDNVLEDVTYYWNSNNSAFVEKKKEVREYNSQQLPVQLTTYTWGGSNWEHKYSDESIKYYYEYYTPLNIPSVVNGTGIKVYPIPANNQVSIDVDAISSMAYTVSIIDMTGKVIFQKDEPANHTTTVVPVSNFASGNYLISVSTDDNHYVNRMVVAH